MQAVFCLDLLCQCSPGAALARTARSATAKHASMPTGNATSTALSATITALTSALAATTRTSIFAAVVAIAAAAHLATTIALLSLAQPPATSLDIAVAPSTQSATSYEPATAWRASVPANSADVRDLCYHCQWNEQSTPRHILLRPQQRPQ